MGKDAGKGREAKAAAASAGERGASKRESVGQGREVAPGAAQSSPAPHAPLPRAAGMAAAAREVVSDAWLGAGVAAATAALYARTLFPGVPGGDSGELMAEACVLGVAHPPGYPLFTLLSHAAMSLPVAPPSWLPVHAAGGNSEVPQADATGGIGSGVPVAWRANMGTALCGAIAAAAVACTTKRLASPAASSPSMLPSVASVAGLLAGMLFALSPLTWMYSVGGEVFALNNCVVALLVYFAVCVDACLLPNTRAGDGAAKVFALAGALVSGLALSNQHTSVLYIGPLALWVLLRGKHVWSSGMIVGMGFAGLVGLSPYAYSVWASHRVTAGSWGDLTTLSGFWRHFSRAEYGSLQLSPMKVAQSMGDRMLRFADHSLALSLPMAAVSPSEENGGVGLAFALGKAAAAVAIGVGAWNMLQARPHGACAEAEAGTDGGVGTGDGAASSSGAKAQGKRQGQGNDKGKASAMARLAAGKRTARGGGVRRFGAGTVLCGAWCVYVVVFHYLANLPTDAAMALGVLARFWMQPDALTCVCTALGFVHVARAFAARLGASANKGSSGARANSGSTSQVATVLMAVVVAWLCVLLQARFAVFDQAAPPDDGWWHSDSDGRRLAPVRDAVALAALPQPDPSRHVGSGGLTVERWGRIVLDTMPKGALLLSHTDLNWNAVRYLQTCEGLRPDVTHLSTQLMPYPWFKRQHSLPTLANVTFPPVARDVSTDRGKKSHAVALAKFFTANADAFPHMFLDLHAVNDVDLSTANHWADTGFQLLPHGPVYRVVPSLSLVMSQRGSPPTSEAEHHDMLWSALQRHGWPQSAHAALRTLRKGMAPPPRWKYDAGTWEAAVGAVYCDAQYQHALLLLSHSVAATGASALPPEAAVAALTESSAAIEDMLAWHDDGVKFSYKLSDMEKNSALSIVKLHGALVGDKRAVEAATLHDRMRHSLRRYISQSPDDPDVGSFAPLLKALDERYSNQQPHG